MYYRYNFDDLDKAKDWDDGSFGFYSLEQLKKHVPLTPFEKITEDDWIKGTWFVYKGDSCSSCTPLVCKSIEEAYENLLEAQNISLYEFYHDL